MLTHLWRPSAPAMADASSSTYNRLFAAYYHETDKTSWAGTLVNFTGSLVTVTVFILPFAVQATGLWALLMLSVTALSSNYTLWLVLALSKDKRADGFEELGFTAFGPKGFWLVALCSLIWSTAMAVASVWVAGSLLSNSFVGVWASHHLFQEDRWNRTLITGVVALPCLIGSLRRHTKKFVLGATLLLGSIALGLVLFAVAAVEHYVDSPRGTWPAPPVECWFQAPVAPKLQLVTSLSCCFVGHHKASLAYNSMRLKSVARWRTIVRWAVAIAAALYVFVGVAGLCFSPYDAGHDVEDKLDPSLWDDHVDKYDDDMNFVEGFCHYSSESNRFKHAVRTVLAVFCMTSFPMDIASVRWTVTQLVAHLRPGALDTNPDNVDWQSVSQHADSRPGSRQHSHSIQSPLPEPETSLLHPELDEPAEPISISSPDPCTGSDSPVLQQGSYFSQPSSSGSSGSSRRVPTILDTSQDRGMSLPGVGADMATRLEDADPEQGFLADPDPAQASGRGGLDKREAVVVPARDVTFVEHTTPPPGTLPEHTTNTARSRTFAERALPRSGSDVVLSAAPAPLLPDPDAKKSIPRSHSLAEDQWLVNKRALLDGDAKGIADNSLTHDHTRILSSDLEHSTLSRDSQRHDPLLTYGEAAACVDYNRNKSETAPMGLITPAHVTLTVFVWLVVVVMAVLAERLSAEFFMHLLSHICGTVAALMAFILPALCYLRLAPMRCDYGAIPVCGVVPNRALSRAVLVVGLTLLILRLYLLIVTASSGWKALIADDDGHCSGAPPEE